MSERLTVAATLFFIIFTCAAGSVSAQDPFPAKKDQPKNYEAEAEPLPGISDESMITNRFTLGNNFWITPHFFAAAGISSARSWDEEDGKTKNDDYYTREFFLKNARIGVNGQIASKLYFAVQSDDFSVQASYNDELEHSFGKKSNILFTKDAYLNFAPINAFQIYTGLLTVPNCRANLLSDATLLRSDKSIDEVSYSSFSESGRDLGVMFRGFLINSVLDYRLGIFRGYGKEKQSDGTIRNENNIPRVTARIQLNAADPEKGYFLSENYLGKRSIFGIGASIDYQPNVYKSDKDYISWSIDIPLEARVQGLFVVSGQVGLISTTNYPDEDSEAYGSFLAWQAQLGVLVADKLQPVAAFTYRNNKDSDMRYKTISGGMNYYFT
ncbi:MAG: hypothetical protein ACRCUT_08520, partial [Spirochaetota bacterium]